MNTTYYLAIDFGASSGRHILAHVENGKIVLEEVHRFKNGFVEKNGHFCWDTDKLFEGIITGMKKCAELGKIPQSMGIDTWGVDFVLLDENGAVLGDTVAYRDSRTDGMDEEVYALVPETELYAKTGIQKAMYNTIYQLMSLKKTEPALLDKAAQLLMIPAYFHYRLTGVGVNEYTLATTTNLVNAETKEWDGELLDKLGFPRRLFGRIGKPGEVLGKLTDEIAKEVGFSCNVVLPATHDTGSAVAAVPANDDDFLYISSGTWSLLGVERMIPDCSEASRKLNFTNEGGVEYRFRYLKNIMGLWMLQSIKRELNDEYGFGELSDLAREAKINSLVDVDDMRFLAPKSMIDTVKALCAEGGQQVPETVGEVCKVVYLSLSDCYRKAIEQMEEVTGRTYSRLHIVGGGCQDGYLNELTAKATGKAVYAGPIEATALGNLLVQMLANGEFTSLAEGREAIARSFDVKPVK
ncbi:MAG: rhamnulokinase [Clostridia bacterium]|nr:rhamnulokinase [Clostridia bacterium]